MSDFGPSGPGAPGVDAAPDVKKEAEPVALEIERKFRVAALPEDIDMHPSVEIDQGYLEITSEREVRLRRKGSKEKGYKYLQTTKEGTGKTRTEDEFEISKDDFDARWPGTEGRRVEKTRHMIPYGDHTIELDVYHGDLDGAMTAEVEFDDEDSSNDFVPPTWMSDELTDDSRWKNKNLALSGLPE